MKVNKTIEYAKIIAFHTGAEYKNIHYVFETLKIKGFLSTIDFYFFISIGVPIYKELSEFLNCSVKEASEFLKEKNMSAEDFDKILNKMISENGVYHLDEKRLKIALSKEPIDFFHDYFK